MLHHKAAQGTAETSALMQLSLTECRELREMLLMDSQEVPSSPTPLLEALESLMDDPPQLVDPSISIEESPVVPPVISVPHLDDLKCKSTTFPPPFFNKNVHLFLRIVTKEITTLTDESVSSNLSTAHQEALTQLKSMKEIVIKEVDKGGCVVVLDRRTL